MRWVYQTERSLGEIKLLLLEIVSVLYVGADDKVAQTVTLITGWLVLAVGISRF